MVHQLCTVDCNEQKINISWGLLWWSILFGVIMSNMVLLWCLFFWRSRNWIKWEGLNLIKFLLFVVIRQNISLSPRKVSLIILLTYLALTPKCVPLTLNWADIMRDITFLWLLPDLWGTDKFNSLETFIQTGIILCVCFCFQVSDNHCNNFNK